jgi:hypothetical protein
MSKEQAVLDWIEQNFEPDAVTITEFPLFPFGKKVTDQAGDEMVVYFDLLTNTVKFTFPGGEQ